MAVWTPPLVAATGMTTSTSSTYGRRTHVVDEELRLQDSSGGVDTAAPVAEFDGFPMGIGTGLGVLKKND